MTAKHCGSSHLMCIYRWIHFQLYIYPSSTFPLHSRLSTSPRDASGRLRCFWHINRSWLRVCETRRRWIRYTFELPLMTRNDQFKCTEKPRSTIPWLMIIHHHHPVIVWLMYIVINVYYITINSEHRARTVMTMMGKRLVHDSCIKLHQRLSRTNH